METKFVGIGNSIDLRLSKTLLEKYDLQDKVEIVLKVDDIMLKPISEPRKGWAEQLRKMHTTGDNQLLIDDVFEDEIFEE